MEHYEVVTVPPNAKIHYQVDSRHGSAKVTHKHPRGAKLIKIAIPWDDTKSNLVIGVADQDVIVFARELDQNPFDEVLSVEGWCPLPSRSWVVAYLHRSSGFVYDFASQLSRESTRTEADVLASANIRRELRTWGVLV